MKTVINARIETQESDSTVHVIFEDNNGEQVAVHLLASLEELKEALDATNESRIEALRRQ